VYPLSLLPVCLCLFLSAKLLPDSVSSDVLFLSAFWRSVLVFYSCLLPDSICSFLYLSASWLYLLFSVFVCFPSLSVLVFCSCLFPDTICSDVLFLSASWLYLFWCTVLVYFVAQTWSASSRVRPLPWPWAWPEPSLLFQVYESLLWFSLFFYNNKFYFYNNFKDCILMIM